MDVQFVALTVRPEGRGGSGRGMFIREGRLLMSVRSYLCGTSKSTYQCSDAFPAQPEDGVSCHLRTRLHFGAAPRQLRFCVLAVLADGREALICLAATREEALAQARKCRLPTGTAAVSLQQWEGRLHWGNWQYVPCRRGELPALPVPRLRRGRRARKQHEDRSAVSSGLGNCD